MRRWLIILLGTALLSAAYAYITVPLRVINGGVTSLSLLLATLSGYPMQWFVNGLTLSLLLLCAVFLGRSYIVGSLVACVGYMGFFALFHTISLHVGWQFPLPVWLGVPVAAAAVGIGYGLCLRQEATIVGFDTLALVITRYAPRVSVPWLMFGINTAVMLLGVRVYGWQAMVYGIAFSFIQSQVLRVFLR